MLLTGDLTVNSKRVPLLFNSHEVLKHSPKDSVFKCYK